MHGRDGTSCKLLFQQTTMQSKKKGPKGEAITKIVRFLFSVLSISVLSTGLSTHDFFYFFRAPRSDLVRLCKKYKAVKSVRPVPLACVTFMPLFIDTWLWVISLPRIDAGQGKGRISQLHLRRLFYWNIPDQILPPLCGLTPSHHDEPSLIPFLSLIPAPLCPTLHASLFILLSQFATDSSQR